MFEQEGSCIAHPPSAYVKEDPITEELIIYPIWPPVEEYHFCFEFVQKEQPLIKKPLFSVEEMITWMNENFSSDYILDLYQTEEGKGISGKILTTTTTAQLTDSEETQIMNYFLSFFELEHIDVSLS